MNKLKSLIKNLVNYFFPEFYYLNRIPYTITHRFQLLITLIKMKLKCVVNLFFPLTSETILSHSITTFNYKVLYYLFNEIFIKGEYYFKTPKKQPLIIDCGANIGIASYYFKWLYPQSTVYSFEPDKFTFDLLKKNTFHHNGKDTDFLINAAVSNKSGEQDFYSDLNNPGALTMSTHQIRMPETKCSVQTISLADFIKNKHVDFLKMDIEGSEFMVIQDLVEKNVICNVDKMIIEFHHNMNTEQYSLADFLKMLEKSKFEYQIHAKRVPFVHQDSFQDILIYCSRKPIESKV